VLLREISRWLHQHIFKVGWLLTHSMQLTTVLYYIAFLPGVVLHQFVFWLAAGVLNVRAEQAIRWPETQDIGALRLEFVHLDRKTPRARRAIISATPIIAGLVVISLIAIDRIRLQDHVALLSTGGIVEVSLAVQSLVAVPDLLLWLYLVFVIANTLLAATNDSIQGWKPFGWTVLTVIICMLLVGIGGQIFGQIAQQLTRFLINLQALLLFIVAVDLIVISALGIAETLIETVTGYSATFQRGRMLTMTRAEARAHRDAMREAEKRQLQKRQLAKPTLSSIYAYAFPVPGSPGDEPVTRTGQILIEAEPISSGASRPRAKSPEILPEGTTNTKSLPKSRPTSAVKQTVKPGSADPRETGLSVDPITTRQPSRDARQPPPLREATHPETKPLALEKDATSTRRPASQAEGVSPSGSTSDHNRAASVPELPAGRGIERDTGDTDTLERSASSTVERDNTFSRSQPPRRPQAEVSESNPADIQPKPAAATTRSLNRQNPPLPDVPSAKQAPVRPKSGPFRSPGIGRPDGEDEDSDWPDELVYEDIED
jgi:hypothetical protein